MRGLATVRAAQSASMGGEVLFAALSDSAAQVAGPIPSPTEGGHFPAGCPKNRRLQLQDLSFLAVILMC